MAYCMITFRSVTPAQRAEGSLRRMGLECSLHRTPRWMEEQGCGYSVRIRQQDAPTAVQLLHKENIAFRKLYLRRESGVMEEMVL